MSGNETDVEPKSDQPPLDGLADEPTVSVIVATRNRPRDLARFLKSAEELDDVGFEIVIADQSDGDESELLCGGSPLASRIRYLRCLPRGKSNAVNHAARVARAPILALTDDDCTPDSLWLRNAVDAFAERPYLSVLFGEFVPIEHDPGREFVPSYRITNPQEYRTVPSASWQSGLGGNMVVRKAAFMAVGGLDECLGPGARFRNADDFDLHHRLVSAGYIAADIPNVIVTHWGARAWADGSAQRLLGASYFGGGAMFAKRIKCRDLRGFEALWEQTVVLLRLSAQSRRPGGIRRLAAMYWGVLRAIPAPVDREAKLFRPRAGGQPSQSPTLAGKFESSEEWV